LAGAQREAGGDVVNVTWPAPRTLVVAGLGLLLVAAIAVGGWYWYDTQQRRVGAAYAEVMTRAYAAQTPQAGTDTRARVAQDLEQLIAQHPAGASAAEAAYELGNLRYAAQQYPAARSAYELAVARGGSPTVRTLARASIGYTWEAERNFAKAIEAYQLVAKDLGPKDFLYEQTLLDMARAQELAGRTPDAIATYQRLLKDFPAARRADEIRGRLVALGAPAPAPTTPPAGR
jgi:tetratricopeptide (TPR) repeat protein